MCCSAQGVGCWFLLIIDQATLTRKNWITGVFEYLFAVVN